MSEAQFSEFIFLEPRDGIVFVRRDIDRSSRPTFDQPDLHFERVGMDLLHGRAGRHYDVDPELLVQLPSKRRAGKLSGSTCPPGRSHTSGYRRRCGDR